MALASSARTATVVLLCAFGGLAIAVLTPAHVEIAGSPATIQFHPGHTYDEVALSGNVLTGKRPTSREVLGEPLGVSLRLDLDPSTFVTPDGTFSADILPAYVQAYSDPQQLGRDLRWVLIKHLLLWSAAGAALGLVGLLAHRLRLFWLQRHVVGIVALVAVLAVIPSADRHVPPAPVIRPDPILASTPLAGTQVGGLLRPALSALQNYIEKYFAETDTYYDELRDTVLLDANDVQLPSAPDITNLVFVTDRHCNIGMDRVIVALAQHFGVKLLVSGGDDDFSGSFPFESACTDNLAAKSQQAGMTDVFVAGNHDSAMTRADEAKQHIRVLDRNIVVADGLTFVGIHDPRTSRYGQGIRPESLSAQLGLLTAQGRATGRIACKTRGPLIAVLHDPVAGQDAIRDGCGRVTVALDGHTHKQTGPVALPTTGGRTAFQFVGGSTGGAPGEGAIERTFASRLTVGPLNHDASINIISVHRTSGALAAVTVCHMTSEQSVTFEQQIMS